MEIPAIQAELILTRSVTAEENPSTIPWPELIVGAAVAA